jgi:hypothetical protein
MRRVSGNFEKQSKNFKTIKEAARFAGLQFCTR